MNIQLEDKIKCRLYEKFYQRNKTLFEKDGVEYWRKCREYAERHYLEVERELLDLFKDFTRRG